MEKNIAHRIFKRFYLKRNAYLNYEQIRKLLNDYHHFRQDENNEKDKKEQKDQKEEQDTKDSDKDKKQKKMVSKWVCGEFISLINKGSKSSSNAIE